MFQQQDPRASYGPELRRLDERTKRSPEEFANEAAAREERRAKRRAFLRRLFRR